MDFNVDNRTEALLIERAKRGDREAFTALVRLYEQKIFRLSMRMLGNYDDAADITQDVFLQAYKHIAHFKGRASFYTWLYRVAVNSCYRFYKKRDRRPLLDRPEHRDEDDQRSLYDRTASDINTPLQELQKEEERKLVRKAIDELPKKLYDVTVLRELEEMAYSDIAEVLHLSEGTVMSRLHRARIALVSNMKKLGLDKI